MPTLRGFGETRFTSAAAPRTGNSGILAMNAVALMDGLGIERFSVVGHDWGSNMAEALAGPRSVWLEDRVRSMQQLSLPVLYIQGEVDGVNPPQVSEKVGSKFSGLFERMVLPGVGHFPSREAPEAVAAKLVEFFGAS